MISMVKYMTDKQLLVLDYIKRFIAEKNYSPTVREIMEGLALKSPSTVHEHLKNLQLMGILTFKPSKSRTIELLVENEYVAEKVLYIPVIGSDEYIGIPIFILNGSNPENVVAYKDEYITYIIDKNLDSPHRKYLFLKDDTYLIGEKINGEKKGTVISKIEIF